MAIDREYLTLQFKNKIFTTIGTEYQTFFENIMEKAYVDFRKIKPYGASGDSGNDGFQKSTGIFYQVYAPNNPKVNEREASKKLEEDFLKISKGWSEISKIKEFYFVFNDKYSGSTQSLESVISKLEQGNPGINFHLLLAIDLERIFLTLDESDIRLLGFSLDTRQIIDFINGYLENIEKELEKENTGLANCLLCEIKEKVYELNDDDICIRYEILDSRCLLQVEKVKEAKDKFENLIIRYPNHPESYLRLAGIHLNEKNYDKNFELIQKARNIEADNYLLIIETMIRHLHLEEDMDIEELEKKYLPTKPQTQSDFYRIFALFFDKMNDEKRADSYIERAIHLNPDKHINLYTKIALLKVRLIKNFENSLREQLSNQLLEEIRKVEDLTYDNWKIGIRQKAILNSHKLTALLGNYEISEYENIAKDTIPLIFKCYLDVSIEQILIELLPVISLPDTEFMELLRYLRATDMELSENLFKTLLFQFDFRGTLMTAGKKFFIELNKAQYVEFINDIDSQNEIGIINFLTGNIELITALTNTFRDFPDLRRKIIENIADDNKTIKLKLGLLLTYDEKDLDAAFEFVKKLDLHQLNYMECRAILQIIREKNAWDFEVIILEKLIEKEKDERIIFNLKLQLFTAHENLTQFSDVIVLGEKLLLENTKNNFLSSQEKRALLTHTINACLNRGKIEESALKKAEELLNSNPIDNPDFEFKIGIEAEIYLKNNEPYKALASIVNGVRIKKNLSPEDYAQLFFLLTVRIADQVNLNILSKDTVQDNSFVKIINQERWYYIGDGNELDAIPIKKTNEKYAFFIGRKWHDKVVYKERYGIIVHEEEVELIFSIEQYILWQTIHHFQNLTSRDALEGVQSVTILDSKENVDLQNLINYFKDLRKTRGPIFEYYCQHNVPLSLLAISEGGLINAIARIIQENRGFLNISTGSREEILQQLAIAQRIITNNEPFYIDGTSAFFLTETGLLNKIFTYAPKIKVPQSVISFLIGVTDRFQYSPSRAGFMDFAQGRIITSSLEKEKLDSLMQRFVSSIKFFESRQNDIGIISSATKVDCVSEMRVPPELCDGCILAQKEVTPIMTEDYLYLKMNETETKKKPPEYFSSIFFFRALFELKKISFDEYLEYLEYLTSYRCRFIPINSIDVEIAVFGNSEIRRITPKNIRKLNFPLTLSEDYGVTFQTAVMVIVQFFIKVINDDTIFEEMAESIFIEILETFPGKMSKRDFGRVLLKICVESVENIRTRSVIARNNKIFQRKIETLTKTVEVFNYETRIVIPKIN